MPPHYTPPDKSTITVLGQSTAAAANEKVHKKKGGEAIVIHLRPLRVAESYVSDLPVAEVDHFDGGLRGWLVVLGAFCASFSTFGYVLSWGVFQAYYEKHILSDHRPSTIAWIGSIQYALLFLPALMVGRLSDMGYFRAYMICASALLVLSIFLVPQCKLYGHFLLCQGLLTGLSAGAIFVPCVALVSQWFSKQRGLALETFILGCAVGGTTIPLIIQGLLPRIGFVWTMRALGFITLALQGIAILVMKQRISGSTQHTKLSLNQFKSFSYSLYCLSTFIIFLGFYTLITYVVSTASVSGAGFYLVAICNAASAVGRVVAGAAAVRAGSLNLLVPLTMTIGVMTYAWPFAQTTTGLSVICIIYGFCMGSYFALIPGPVVEMGDIKEVTPRIGMVPAIMGIGAFFGPPIAGDLFYHHGLKSMGFYTGSMVLCGAFLLAIVKFLLVRKQL